MRARDHVAVERNILSILLKLLIKDLIKFPVNVPRDSKQEHFIAKKMHW
jgi:hypothetical protein